MFLYHLQGVYRDSSDVRNVMKIRKWGVMVVAYSEVLSNLGKLRRAKKVLT